MVGRGVSETLKMARVALIKRMISSLKTRSQKECLCERHEGQDHVQDVQRLQLKQMRFTEVSGEGRS